jgi:uncharacterized protein
MQIQIVYWLVITLMILCVVGAVIPALPGSSLILIAIIAWGFIKGSFDAISTPLIVTVMVLIVSVGVDFLGGYIGAKKAGASNWGQIGALVGLVLGFFGLLPALPFGGPLIGMLFGPLLGAIIGEYLYQKDLGIAVKAGVGIIVGSLLGNLIQGLLALAAVFVFIITTWTQVYGG